MAPTEGRVLEGVIKLPLARRRRETVGDIDSKSLHLGPEIDATHTLLVLTATYMSRQKAFFSRQNFARPPLDFSLFSFFPLRARLPLSFLGPPPLRGVAAPLRGVAAPLREGRPRGWGGAPPVAPPPQPKRSDRRAQICFGPSRLACLLQRSPGCLRSPRCCTWRARC